MKVIIVEPNKKARITEIENGLKSLQKTVGGYIECIYPFTDDVAIICNEEGKFNGSEPNRALKDESGKVYDIIFGTFIITGLTEDSFGSLTDDLAAKYLSQFILPEIFLNTSNGLVVLKLSV